MSLEPRLDLPASQRHVWKVMRAFGPVCARCGTPKPRATERETACKGRVLLTPAELLRHRQAAVPAMMLGWAWTRATKSGGWQIHPSVMKANANAMELAFAGLDQWTFLEQRRMAAEETKRAFQAVHADTPPDRHANAVALMIATLASKGDVSQDSQPHLTALAMLEDCEDKKDGELAKVANRMLTELRTLGYYRPRKGGS